MSQADVLDYLEENGPATREELVESLDTGKSTINHNLLKLHKWKDHYIIKTGKNESGKRTWNVIRRGGEKQNESLGRSR